MNPLNNYQILNVECKKCRKPGTLVLHESGDMDYECPRCGNTDVNEVLYTGICTKAKGN